MRSLVRRSGEDHIQVSLLFVQGGGGWKKDARDQCRGREGLSDLRQHLEHVRGAEGRRVFALSPSSGPGKGEKALVKGKWGGLGLGSGVRGEVWAQGFAEAPH